MWSNTQTCALDTQSIIVIKKTLHMLISHISHFGGRIVRA